MYWRRMEILCSQQYSACPEKNSRSVQKLTSRREERIVFMSEGQRKEAAVLQLENMAAETEKMTKTRWSMLALIMLVMCLNYLDRGNLAVSAPVMQKELERL